MALGPEGLITLGVTIFLFILGIGVKILQDISNSLAKSNAKLDNVVNEISDISHSLNRTNELLVRQNERSRQNSKSTDGGFEQSNYGLDEIKKSDNKLEKNWLSKHNTIKYELISAEEVEGGSSSAQGDEDYTRLRLSSNEELDNERANMIVESIFRFVKIIIDNPPVEPDVTISKTNDGHEMFITIPTMNAEEIEEFLHHIETQFDIEITGAKY